MSEQSIYDRIGFGGLVSVVLRAAPLHLTLFALPYNLYVYGSFLKGNTTLNGVELDHLQKYHTSKLFKICRPRYHKVKKYLEKRKIE